MSDSRQASTDRPATAGPRTLRHQSRQGRGTVSARRRRKEGRGRRPARFRAAQCSPAWGGGLQFLLPQTACTVLQLASSLRLYCSRRNRAARHSPIISLNVQSLIWPKVRIRQGTSSESRGREDAALALLSALALCARSHSPAVDRGAVCLACPPRGRPNPRLLLVSAGLRPQGAGSVAIWSAPSSRSRAPSWWPRTRRR